MLFWKLVISDINITFVLNGVAISCNRYTTLCCEILVIAICGAEQSKYEK